VHPKEKVRRSCGADFVVLWNVDKSQILRIVIVPLIARRRAFAASAWLTIECEKNCLHVISQRRKRRVGIEV